MTTATPRPVPGPPRPAPPPRVDPAPRTDAAPITGAQSEWANPFSASPDGVTYFDRS